jgi:NAD(P)H-dependent FMN reductase
MSPDLSASDLQPKNILGLVASHRRLGNCELFIKEIYRHIPGKPLLHLVRLTELNIESCNGCYGCIVGKPCPHKDHMPFLLEQVRTCDAIIIAAPVYFLGAQGVIKRILDRGFLFYPDADANHHKPCILLNLYGINEKVGVSSQALRTLASLICADVRASVNVRAALPGEVLWDRRYLRMAERLGTTLFSGRRMKAAHGCPFCGCEIVRMKKEEFICTLCHGTFVMGKQNKAIGVCKGDAVGSPAHLHEHATWLRNMKDRFLERRRDIARTVEPYKDVGTWLTPP